MEFKENETDTKEIQITKELIKIPIYYKDEKYIINIYPSKDNINIVFKLEKDKVITYYFFEKFDLKDFKQKNKIFSKDINIKEVFSRLTDMAKKYFINLEIKGIKMNILFKNVCTNDTFKFNLKKRIVSQTKINSLLEDQITDNTTKLNIFRNQIIKLDKTHTIKNDIINNINIRIANINNTLNNISIINTNNSNAVINLSSTKNSSSNESNSENNNNEDEYPESVNSADICQNQKQDSTNDTNNNTNNKKESKNNNNDKTFVNNNKSNNNKSNNDKSNNNLEIFFCLEKNDPAQNKKIIEFLIILNIITIIVVIYMLCSIYTIRTNFDSDDMDDDNDINNNRLAYLSFINSRRGENAQNFADFYQEDDGITSSAKINEYLEKKRKKAAERYLYYTNDYY